MSAFEMGKRIVQDAVVPGIREGFETARDRIRAASVPETDEHTAFVEVIVTFPGGHQARYGSQIGIDGEAFTWSASKDGNRFRVQGTTEAAR